MAWKAPRIMTWAQADSKRLWKKGHRRHFIAARMKRRQRRAVAKRALGKVLKARVN